MEGIEITGDSKLDRKVALTVALLASFMGV